MSEHLSGCALERRVKAAVAAKSLAAGTHLAGPRRDGAPSLVARSFGLQSGP
jgi:hypothetical protein